MVVRSRVVTFLQHLKQCDVEIVQFAPQSNTTVVNTNHKAVQIRQT